MIIDVALEHGHFFHEFSNHGDSIERVSFPMTHGDFPMNHSYFLPHFRCFLPRPQSGDDVRRYVSSGGTQVPSQAGLGRSHTHGNAWPEVIRWSTIVGILIEVLNYILYILQHHIWKRGIVCIECILLFFRGVVEYSPFFSEGCVESISGWWWLEHDFYFSIYFGNVIIPID